VVSFINDYVFALFPMFACVLYSLSGIFQEKHVAAYESPYLEIIGLKGVARGIMISILYPILTWSSYISLSGPTIEMKAFYFTDGRVVLVETDKIHLFSENFVKLLYEIFNDRNYTLYVPLTMAGIISSHLIYYLVVSHLLFKDVDISIIQIIENLKCVSVCILYFAFYSMVTYVFYSHDVNQYKWVSILEYIVLVLLIGFVP